MGAVAQFITFGAGLVTMAVVLKSLDRVLYSLDERRPERIKEHALTLKALQEQQRLLQEKASA